jgi:hypothetical protein
MRDDPARISGPTSVTMAKPAARSSGELRLHVRAMVFAPRRRAYLIAATVKGVALTVYKIAYSAVDENPEVLSMCLKRLVGERGFEPPTPWSRSKEFSL